MAQKPKTRFQQLIESKNYQAAYEMLDGRDDPKSQEWRTKLLKKISEQKNGHQRTETPQSTATLSKVLLLLLGLFIVGAVVSFGMHVVDAIRQQPIRDQLNTQAVQTQQYIQEQVPDTTNVIGNGTTQDPFIKEGPATEDVYIETGEISFEKSRIKVEVEVFCRRACVFATTSYTLIDTREKENYTGLAFVGINEPSPSAVIAAGESYEAQITFDVPNPSEVKKEDLILEYITIDRKRIYYKLISE